MKTTIVILTTIAVLGGCAAAFAGTSVSISVSCTVPAVPGVNVPLVESRQAALIEAQGSADASHGMLVKTFYAR
jgi:hypothetical protein